MSVHSVGVDTEAGVGGRGGGGADASAGTGVDAGGGAREMDGLSDRMDDPMESSCTCSCGCDCGWTGPSGCSLSSMSPKSSVVVVAVAISGGANARSR